MRCKRLWGKAVIYGPGETVEAPYYVHPRGCMGARQNHIDIALERDPCGLLEILSRGGHRVRVKFSGDDMVIEMGRVVGVPCTIIVGDTPKWLRKSTVYVGRGGSGALYVSPVNG
ncbi:MAG: hypothetical protein F7C35_06075 [Desulfurococcales archaeon]|nr:hypothetical protein [Desulfurococcales archaeon]